MAFRRGARVGKYGAKQVTQDGHKFSSKLECAVYNLLLDMEKRFMLSNIKLQPSVYLTHARIRYVPDFSFVNKKGETEYVEAKGQETDVWRIKRRLWMFYGGGVLHVYKGTHLRPVLHEIIHCKSQ